ncbi:3-hydroxyacyl-CoA dehydrogenase NAD-binding domain-containing protein [Paeniglutamicibacter cryotolerans]|uniref:3-hydroxybutyryl-CoA dehydrogenase n=1 Tax=Paeniglutamicibacter cryotolerans TaxID=670079 RepID=A0A839QLT7_9MICC|nr:3-hydroxyacyl-CoA dehydrogenase NAD-binding domain-containing protein [Paeniglutamicibacter cryotolerans]MBB2995724.1 3-hydroxybutyryl-CoA dehydrogenase [Paeniglutamicibacter cryotolerans]
MSTSDADIGTGSIERVASLGGGVIGQSWTALFLAAGKKVSVFDPDPSAPERVRAAVAEAWPILEQLGLAENGSPDNITFCADAREAVDGADFVQESVPEQVALKHELYGLIEPVLGSGTIVASSASGLTLTEMQAGWRDPSRFILGHPFNPPHLIPLVEVMGNDRTAAGVVDAASRFYESIGKVTIEIKREVPGHVANRLQAALWREAIHLINEGVASVEDVDKAVSAGPGLRWAAMGPTQLFHLGAGDGGLSAFCDRYTESFNRWFDDLGTPHLDAATVSRLVAGLSANEEPHSIEELARRRDALIARMVALKASQEVLGGTR